MMYSYEIVPYIVCGINGMMKINNVGFIKNVSFYYYSHNINKVDFLF